MGLVACGVPTGIPDPAKQEQTIELIPADLQGSFASMSQGAAVAADTDLALTAAPSFTGQTGDVLAVHFANITVSNSDLYAGAIDAVIVEVEVPALMGIRLRTSGLSPPAP